MLCPNCKKEIENGSAFCEHCGTRIGNDKQVLWKILAVISAGFIIVSIASVSCGTGHSAFSIYFFLAVILLIFSIIKIW